MIRSSSVLCGLVVALSLVPVTRITAQTPNLYWMQRQLEIGQSTCLDTATRGLVAGTMYNVTPGTERISGVRAAVGSNSNLNAAVLCVGDDEAIATVIVAGSEGYLGDVQKLGEFLSNFMMGERDGVVGLSESEQPVKMNEWLSGDWCLGCEGTETERRYSGEIVAPARSMRLRLRSGRAESGVGSVEILVYDPTGKLVLTEESNHDDWAEWRVGIVNYGRYEVVVRSLSKNTAEVTNNGEIQVLVR